MNLKVLIPTEILLQEVVNKVIAEAMNGSFCLLEHHVDFTATLAPGILAITIPEKGEELVAIDEGTLVKYGSDVLVSVRNAVRGVELEKLKQIVDETFQVLDEKEKTARAAAAKLEADIVRRFVELRDRG
ncbi:MAG: F0F1 ATP synthase subunit epsilon [Deltaproteobacteria bacterium]|nr:F0F1 ATP synthase subunit epsilon [Deltaproteobacteria bacterium]